jgi:hypothetical protein
MHRPLAFLTSHFGNRPPWPHPLFPTPTDSLNGHLHSSSRHCTYTSVRSLPSASTCVIVSTTSAGRHVHLPLILTRQYNFIRPPRNRLDHCHSSNTPNPHRGVRLTAYPRIYPSLSSTQSGTIPSHLRSTHRAALASNHALLACLYVYAGGI